MEKPISSNNLTAEGIQTIKMLKSCSKNLSDACKRHDEHEEQLNGRDPQNYFANSGDGK